MRLTEIKVTNFRLLENVDVNIEKDMTIIVGKNNSGKTSLFEIINLFFNDRKGISFHDFSMNTYSKFLSCYKKYSEELLSESNEEKKDELEKELSNEIPRITLEIQIEYDKKHDSLINISDFISDLDENRTDVTVLFKYEPENTIGLLKAFHHRVDKDVNIIEWLNENISAYYNVRVFGGDNLIEDNVYYKIKSIFNFETIQASRKLDDTKADNHRSLALGFSDYYKTVNSDTTADVEDLKKTLSDTSDKLDGKYGKVLERILSQLKLFGVDKEINIPEIILKSKFDPETIIKNNIKYFYKNGGVELPENYNGLGYSNLIYLVLKIVSFIESFKKRKENNETEILTILIEEPEAHLHPQMQQVFVEQIRETIKEAFLKDGVLVQIIMSTHSSHMIAEAGLNVKRSFERIRYFTRTNEEGKHTVVVKDFNDFKREDGDKETYRFLKQYLNLNKSDLFFADKVIMVEGITEKLLMPLFIKKEAPQLENEYVSIIDVGGNYTEKFKEFFKFLGTKVLVVTDIDSVDGKDGIKCHVLKEGAETINSTLSKWLPGKKKILELLALEAKDKLDDSKLIRVAYQIQEDEGIGLSGFVARSLENAVINCNKEFFSKKYSLPESSGTEREVYKDFSFQKLKKFDDLINMDTSFDQSKIEPNSTQKTNFTFDLMTFDEEGTGLKWSVPKYIKEGLVWLVGNGESGTKTDE